MDKSWNCTNCQIEVTTTYCPKCNKNSRGGKRFVSKFSNQPEQERTSRPTRPDQGDRSERPRREITRSNVPDWTCEKCNILIHSGREYCIRCKNDINGRPQMHKCQCGRNINIKFKTCRDCSANTVTKPEPKPLKPTADAFDFDLYGRKINRPIVESTENTTAEQPVVKQIWGGTLCREEGCSRPCGINLVCFSCIARNSKEPPAPVPEQKIEVPNDSLRSRLMRRFGTSITNETKDIPSGTLDFSLEDDGVDCRDIPENDNIIITNSWDEL